MAGGEDVLVEDITEEQLAKEKKEEQQGSEEESIPTKKEKRKRMALGVRRRQGTKAPTRSLTANARLRAQIAKMEADMSAMRKLMERAATPEKVGVGVAGLVGVGEVKGTAGVRGSIERAAKSGVSNPLVAGTVPRQLAQEMENILETPVGVGMSAGVGVGISNGVGIGKASGVEVGKGESRRRVIEEKQRELMALLAAEEREASQVEARSASLVGVGVAGLVGVGEGGGLGGASLTPQTMEYAKENVKSGTKHVPGATSSPFTRGVLEAVMPKKLRIPELSFDGRTDPDDHVNSFITRMRLNDAEDGAWCKIFPATLTGIAQSWFNGLPKGSIGTFDELSALFSAQFTSSKRRDKKTVELMTMKQKKGESLKEYIGRFNAEVTSIPNVEQSLAIAALAHSLNHGLYRDYLIKSDPKTLGEAFKEANQHILLEEYNRSVEQPVGQGEGSRSRDQGRRHMKPSWEEFTSLTKTPAAIFSIHRNEHYWAKPKKMGPNPRDTNRWCDYHQDHGHTTEQCADLRNEVEYLVREGYLSKYRRDRAEKQEGAPQNQNLPHPSERKVNIE